MKNYNVINDFILEVGLDQNKDLGRKLVNSRFGGVVLNLNKKIFFNGGLLGINGSSNFCLANFPKSKETPFKILQSLEDDKLSLLVLPLFKNDNGLYPFIDIEDIESLYKEFEVTPENLVLILIVNIIQIEGKSQAFVNARAPLVIDINKMEGVQYVFQNNKYSVRQALN